MKWKISSAIGFGLWLLVTISSQGENSDWRSRSLEKIEAAETLTKDEKFEILAPLVRAGNQGLNRPSDAQREVSERAIATMLAAPGYADYFSNRLRLIRDEALKGGAGSINLLEDAQLTCFQTLAMLPSAESVRVLGEFLSDEEERVPPSPPGQLDDRNARQRELGISFNASYSLTAIAKLPIVSPPLPRRKRDRVVYDEDIDAWRVWYEQVKSGKRTFRFEGDPQEYNLAGPVAKVVEPGVSRSQSGGADPPSQDASAKPSKLPTAALAGAIALLIAAVWLAMKKRSAAARG